MAAQKKEITLTCSVDSYRSGWEIIRFLSHRFPYHTPEAWERRVLDGKVLVNGAGVDPTAPVQKDDLIQYTIFHAEPDVDFRYDLVYEDEHMLVVSKSGNLPVHACGAYITHTLIARIRAEYGDTVNLAHRLDRETSGLVLMSKDRESARRLSALFSGGTVTKSYLAVVYGTVREERFEVDAPIGKVDVRPDPHRYDDGYEVDNRASYLPKRAIDPVNGKPARTLFTRVRQCGEWTVLDAQPLTGRTNQIRVHLAHAGYPLLGDKIYALQGAVREELLSQGLTGRVREALVLDRHALHCRGLEFEHPYSGETLSLTAPVPADLGRFI
jgi:23S rRNA pseudouridine1911/1915/1917 synthase